MVMVMRLYRKLVVGSAVVNPLVTRSWDRSRRSFPAGEVSFSERSRMLP